MPKKPQRRLVTVRITQIVQSRIFTRSTPGGDTFRDLIKSIDRTGGPIQAPLVRERGRGKYEIIAGWRRWQAALQAKQDELQVVVVPADDREAAILMLTENLHRDDLGAVDEAEQYWIAALLLQQPKRGGSTPHLSAREAAAVLAPHVGKSADTIRKILATLPEDSTNRERLRAAGAKTEHIRLAQSILRGEVKRAPRDADGQRLSRPMAPIWESLWVAAAEQVAQRGWTLQTLKEKRSWARELAGEVAAIRTDVRGAETAIQDTVRAAFEVAEPLGRAPLGRRHRCPACGHEWRGSCLGGEAKAKRIPGQPTLRQATIFDLDGEFPPKTSDRLVGEGG